MDTKALYSKEHYYVFLENDIATVGFTDYFLSNLGEVQDVELPQVRNLCNKTDVIGSVFCEEEEISICSVFTGEIIEVNDLAQEDFEQFKNSPMGDSWLYRISLSNPLETEELVTEEEYNTYLDELFEKNPYVY